MKLKYFRFIATIVIVGAFFALSGCKSYYLNKYCKPETTRRDSTVFVMKLKDSTFIKNSIVVHPATQSFIYIPSPCDSIGRIIPGTYTSSQGNNKTSVVITDTGITVQSNCQETISQWQSLYQNTKDSLSRYQKTNEKTVVEKQLSWFQSFRQNTSFFWWAGMGCFAGILITLIYKLIRFFKKLR